MVSALALLAISTLASAPAPSALDPAPSSSFLRQDGAQEPTPEPAPPADAPPGEAAPTGPAPEDGAALEGPQPDWIRLTSNEWLKGEIVLLRDDELEFESDVLETLEIDWGDVAEVRSTRVHSVLLEGRRTRVGRIRVEGDSFVLTDGEEERIPRDQLLAIVPGAPTEWNYWSGRLSLGATHRTGNTDQTDLSAFVSVKRETAATRWNTSYNGAYTEVETVQTANNHRVDSRFDWFLSDRLYVTPASLQVFRDPFQNIGLRFTPAAGVGYDVLDGDDMDLSLLVGPAYQHTKYDSTVPGEDDTDGTAAGFATLGYSWDVTSDWELGLDYSVTVPVPDTETYTSRLTALIEVELIGDFDLELRVVWDHVNAPRAEDDGNVPKKDDFRTTIGVGWEF